MDTELIFGILFFIWILLALPLMSRQETEDKLPDLPGKKQYESKTFLYWSVWTGGLLLLFLIRWLVTGKFIT